MLCCCQFSLGVDTVLSKLLLKRVEVHPMMLTIFNITPPRNALSVGIIAVLLLRAISLTGLAFN